MGKAVKKVPYRNSPYRGNTPNATTREAIEAVRRGEVEPAKDIADLLKKLKA
jgi:hypothetical protein